MTILMYYNIKPNREKLLKSIKYKKDNYNAYDIVKMSNIYGLKCSGIKTELNKITKLPVIAHVITKENMYHFIVIFKIDKKRRVVEVMDPSIGLTEIKFDVFKKITTNIYLTFKKTKNIKKENRLKKILLKIIKTNKKNIFNTLIISLAFIFLSLTFNYYLKLILTYNNQTSFLNIITIFFIFICIFKNIFYNLKNNLELKLNYTIENNLTKKVINHLLNLPHRYFNTKSSGEIVTIIEDLESFKYCITKICIMSFIDIFLLLIILLYIIYLNLKIGIFFIFVLVILYIVTSHFKYIFNNKFTPYKIKNINYTSSLIEILNNIESIKNLNISEKISKRLENSFIAMNISKKKYYSKINKYNLTNSFLTDIFYILLISLFIFFFKNDLKSYDIVLYSSLFYMILSFYQNILDQVVTYKVEEVKVNRVLDLLEEPQELKNERAYSLINKISFKNIYYKNILKNINLELKKGDHVFLTGKSGIGKTSLINILLKNTNQTKGQILIDDIDIVDYSPYFIREKITYCGQNEHLFKGTIKDNLSIINSNYQDISKLTLLDKIINEKTENYFIEEFGSNLSGGEKKKLILTRALLKMNEVLILDEATNEISIEEESVILKNIINKYKDKIIIFISHRTNNMDLFNKKYYLKGDDIIEIK